MNHEVLSSITKATIAVVDDDSAVRNSLAFAFQSEGFQVRAYEYAEELLADDLTARVNCFIVDYRLPGLNGLELLASLRKSGIIAPAVLITTEPNAEVRRSAVALRAVIVEKPLLGEALFRCVRQSLAKNCSP